MTTLQVKDRGDAELVQLAQGGDTRAFDELVRRYKDRVYRLSYKILRHEEDAAEALQDAFLSAYRGLKNFKAESTFSTWLYRIATNASLMKYRKRREGHVSLEQSQSSDGGAEPMQIPDWTQQPLTELLTSETREVMGEGIEKLPEELRTVFVLRDVECAGSRCRRARPRSRSSRSTRSAASGRPSRSGSSTESSEPVGRTDPRSSSSR